MKILLVNYRYFISGGPEKYLFNIKKKLEEEGHEVIPFSVHSNKNVHSDYSKYFVEPIGSRDAVYYEECKKTVKVLLQMVSRSVYSFQVEKAVKRIITDTKPDIVYVIHYVNKLSPSVIRGAKQMGLPVVLRLSDYFLLCPRFDFLFRKRICEDCQTKGYWSCIRNHCVKDSLFASLIRVFSMKVHQLIKVDNDIDAYIAPSEFLKNKMIKYGYPEEKIYCIPTFAVHNQGKENPVAGEYGLYFGRITEEKGVDTLVQTYELLTADYRLVITGDDSTCEAVRLKKYVKERELANIEFSGFKLGSELEDIIRKARFTFIPSLWYDNLPNTALEAFQFFKPVLASNIGSLPELVTAGDNGFLFTPGSVEEVVQLVKRMDNKELVTELGENGHNQLLGRFSANTHYESLMSVFHSLIKK